MSDPGFGISNEIGSLSLADDMERPPPPALRTRSQGIIATDITSKFAEAVSTLAPGQLVKDASFTLFESVAALEIMDPKMDSGCVESEADLEELYDVAQPLLPEQVLGIIDQLLCLEMAWHLGYPLSQTVLTSVYIEALSMPDPRSIDQAKFVRDDDRDTEEETNPMLEVLRAYCLGVLKTCGYVNASIKGEHFYEEEDFVANTYNRTLLKNVPTTAIQHTIENARDTLKSQGDKLESTIGTALDRRLELRSIFLEAAQCLQHVKEPDAARKPWIEGLALLSHIKATHSLQTPVEEAFSVKLQRKLASTMPPRPIVKLSFDDAFGHLSRLFKDGVEVIDVLNYTDSQCLQTFVFTFQAKKPQPLLFIRTLLQAFIFNDMELLGRMSFRQILDDDFSIITMPASILLDRLNDEVEAVHDPRFAIADRMEMFRQRAAQPYLDVLRTFCQNRCRVRRTLCHIIKSWENLEFDAAEIDHDLHTHTGERPVVQETSPEGQVTKSFSLPLTSWVNTYKLRLMEWIVQLGFELEVYQADELAGMYWYLNYLSKSRVEHTEHVKSIIIRKLEDTREQARTDPTIVISLQGSLTFVRLSMLDSAVTRELSDSLSCLYTVLARLQLVKPPPRPYSNDELRYELRMKPFESIGRPKVPTFDDFVVGTKQPEMTSLEMLGYAESAFMAAKKGFEALSKLTPEEAFAVGSQDRWTETVKNGLKSCIAAGIAISTTQRALRQMKAAHEQEHGKRPEVEQWDPVDEEREWLDLEKLKIKAEVPAPTELYHDWWIVPKVTSTR